MAPTLIRLPYNARKQFIPFHERRQRWACVVAHRRAGKTVGCIMDTVDAAMRSELPSPRYAYIAPYYAQAKDVVWSYLKSYTAGIPNVQTHEAELRIDLPGDRRVRLYGADNYDRLRGIYLDGVVLDEYADMDPRAWSEVIRPALSDRKGWATFIGTPKGRNSFYDLWDQALADPEWYTLMLRASETGLVDPAELADAAKSMTPEQYAQEFECSFDAAIIGAYYGQDIANAEREGRITAVGYEPALPLHTAWDLGIGDSTSIWVFQVASDGVRFVDHYENHGQPLAHYAAELASRGWKTATDWVPHDAKVRELGTGRTRIETLQQLGRNPKLVPDHRLMDGINAARVSLGRMWFDADRCKFGLEALRQYHTEFDAKTRAYKDTPKHDWTSHTADAFRYAAMAWREIKPEVVAKPKPKELILTAMPDGTVQGNMSVRERVEMLARKRRNSER